MITNDYMISTPTAAHIKLSSKSSCVLPKQTLLALNFGGKTMVAKTKKVTMGIKASKNYASDCEASRIVSIGPLKSNEMAANNFAAAVQNKSFKIRSYPKKSRQLHQDWMEKKQNRVFKPVSLLRNFHGLRCEKITSEFKRVIPQKKIPFHQEQQTATTPNEDILSTGNKLQIVSRDNMRLSIDWPPHRLEVANSLIKLKQNHKVIVLNTEWLAEASNKVSITYNPHSEKWQNKPTKLIVISIDALYSQKKGISWKGQNDNPMLSAEIIKALMFINGLGHSALSSSRNNDYGQSNGTIFAYKVDNEFQMDNLRKIMDQYGLSNYWAIFHPVHKSIESINIYDIRPLMQEMQLILLEEKSKVDIDIPIVGDGKCLPVENNIELLLSWLVDNLPEITTTNKKHQAKHTAIMEEEYYSAYVSSGYRHPQKSRLLKESVRNSLQIDQPAKGIVNELEDGLQGNPYQHHHSGRRARKSEGRNINSLDKAQLNKTNLLAHRLTLEKNIKSTKEEFKRHKAKTKYFQKSERLHSFSNDFLCLKPIKRSSDELVENLTDHFKFLAKELYSHNTYLLTKGSKSSPTPVPTQATRTGEQEIDQITRLTTNRNFRGCEQVLIDLVNNNKSILNQTDKYIKECRWLSQHLFPANSSSQGFTGKFNAPQK